MRVKLDWQGGAAFNVCTESGHTFVLDGPPEHGGQNLGARPMEMFLAGAAACSAFDVVHILRRGRCAPEALAVCAEGTRAKQEPKVYTRIHLAFVARGEGLEEAVLARAARLSVEKYCSALQMLQASCEVSFSCALARAEEGGA